MKPLQLDDTKIDKVIEIERLPVSRDWLFSNCSAQDVASALHWLDERFIVTGTGDLVLSHHSFLIRRNGLTILVDTCNGNYKNRESAPFWDMLDTPFLSRLAELGVKPEDVNLVLCTHLHADHVGWNTRLDNGEWVPTFPNARYIMGRSEFEHWNRLHNSGSAKPVNRGSFLDSVLPVVDRGLAQFVDDSATIVGELETRIFLRSAAGHTPGNVNIHLVTGAGEAIFSGDVIHHPIQCMMPHICNSADFDIAMSLAARASLLDRCAHSGALLLPAHFPAQTAGHVVPHGSAYRFKFLE